MEDRFWIKHYPQGIAANIDIMKYNNIVDFMQTSIDKYPNKEAFVSMGKTLTYKEIGALSDQFGAYLQSRGLLPGDKIAIMMPNMLQFPIAALAALKAGLIIVNTNPLYMPREMEHQFKDSEVKAIIIAENFASNLQKIISKTNISVVITTGIGDMLGMVKSKVVNFVIKNIKGMVPKYSLPNAVNFMKALKEGKSFQLKLHTAHRTDVAVHQYTGGTTGVSKGAMLTHENILANSQQIIAWMGRDFEPGGEVVLTALPMYHIFAFTVNFLAMFHIGGFNVLIANPRDQKGLVKEYKKYPITVVTAVNTLFNAMANNPDFQKLDFSTLKKSVAGGMALQRAVAKKWQEVTGNVISEGYGLTECSPVVTCNPVDGTAKVGTIGLPVPNTFVKIVDENRNEVGVGEVGEIAAKGPQVMLGYYNRPEETAKVLQDGWLYTGDMAKLRDDGYLQIVDRKKDMILVSGFNVYPNEVEDVIAEHPKVMEVCVIGIPSEKSGEEVKAFVVKKDSSLTEEEVINHCRENLTGYKRPRHVEFRQELPKTNVGKILRRALRDEELKK